MITLQRQLLIEVRKETIESGNGPRNTQGGIFYPVIGYETGKRLASSKAGTEAPKEYDDIRFLYFVNDKGYIEKVFPNQCFIFVDYERGKVANNGEEKS